jgi:3-oxoacyl-[acyl-carrier-protein] synthase-1
MTTMPIAITSSGLITSVGLSAPASCAAIRAKISNAIETSYIDSAGEWIMAHQVPLSEPLRGRTKLAKMAALAIEECLADVPRDHWRNIPLFLCVAESERPGRIEGLDDLLLDEVQQELAAVFAEQSMVIPRGRVSTVIALARARASITDEGMSSVLIAATDSLVNWPTLRAYEEGDRLLTAENSNGFMPGEGAGALLIEPAVKQKEHLVCGGIGFADESANFESGQPLCGEGLTRAIQFALAEAGCAIQDIDFRVTDIGGEQYYFKEASLAVARLLRVHKQEFDLWHAAECVGEVGAVSGIVGLASASAACSKGYAPGPALLWHSANDAGQRAAAVFRYGIR